MTFNRYYQDELTFLREMGKEFAAAHPDAAHFLADRGSDPDVERLLEGFAFLTGRLRQKIDDELPEVTHSMMGLLWPHYLRPIPSITLMQFTPSRGTTKERLIIPRGVDVDSVPVEGTPCRFRTTAQVTLDPVEIVEASLETPAAGAWSIRLRMKTAPGVKLTQLRLDRLRFFLAGEPTVTSALYLLFARSVAEVTAASVAGGRVLATTVLPPDSITMAGFSDDEALFPYPTQSFPGYRLIQEYFAFPQKFLFLEIGNLERLADLGGEDMFDIVVRLAHPPRTSFRISAQNFLMGCTPAVNLFERDGDPIVIEHDKTEYLVRASGRDPSHYEIYSVDSVVGFAQGTAEPRTYPGFYTFLQKPRGTGANDDLLYHYPRLRPAVVGDGTETYLSFFSAKGEAALPPTENVSIRLTCTNRRLPRSLRVGDIATPTTTSPEFARFRNISNVTGSVSPPLEGDLHWRLISHLTLNYQSLTSVEALRTILSLYNFQALYDRQAARENELKLEGIRSVRAVPQDALFKGSPVRGLHTTVELAEQSFAGEGDLVLFASILNEFLALYASVNSFSRLTVRNAQSGEVYAWSPRLGRQNIL
jgi:type VI secretion system protein ImpG